MFSLSWYTFCLSSMNIIDVLFCLFLIYIVFLSFLLFYMSCCIVFCFVFVFFFFKQKTAYEMRISDWSSDVCSSDLMITKQPGDIFLYERGLVDYVEYLNKVRHAEVVNDEIIAFESEDKARKISLEVAMQWTTSYTENVFTYANTINTHEGGTHEEGFRAALTTLVNKYARANNILKEKDDNLSGEDVREGLTAVISIKLGEPQFEGQTQDRLGNTDRKSTRLNSSH